MAWASLGGITGGQEWGSYVFVVLRYKNWWKNKDPQLSNEWSEKTYASIMKQCSKQGVSLHFTMTHDEHLGNSGSSRDKFLLVPWII